MGKATSRLSTLLVLFFLGIAATGAYTLLRDLEGPAITLSPGESGRIGPNQDMSLTLRDSAGVRNVAVVIKRGGQAMTLIKQDFTPAELEKKLTFSLKEAKLPEGAFELEIKSYDASWAGFGKGNSSTVSLPMRLDSQPPRIAVKTVPPSIRRGGSALIVYTVTEEVDKTGVQVGDYFFPGHKQANGGYASLFPFPFFMAMSNFSPEIMARDTAGNVTSSRLLVNAQNRNFKVDTLSLGDKFLQFKAADVAALCPEKETTLEQYICTNNKVRLENDARLLELGANTASSTLWEGNFQRLPKSAVKANFGDFRTYNYNGQKIDEQTHTGLDLASVANADIPASQAGTVIYAEPLGIYGLMVLIDHGLGLMTLYSHCSELLVAVGDTVAAGQIIGKTGTTGMAGGDHVHFSTLIGGIPVQPIEWLDPAWVRNNITNRLKTSI